MTLGEIILGAFDLATEFARKRVQKATGIGADGPVVPFVTRDDFEQAVIAMRFDAMGLQLSQIDLMNEMHRKHMDELRARLEAERASGDVPDVTLIDPDEPPK